MPHTLTAKNDDGTPNPVGAVSQRLIAAGSPPLPATARILVYVGLDLIGDGLIKLPLVRALRAALPQAQLVWLAGKGRSAYRHELAPLVEPLLDAVIDEADIGSRWAELFGRPLGDQRFDLVIDTQRRLLTTLILRRITADRFVSPAGGFAFSTVRPPSGYHAPRLLSRELLDLMELGTGYPAQPGPPLALPQRSLDAARQLLPEGLFYVGLVPGAGGTHKCWPLAHYITVGRTLEREGRTPVFILGPKEGHWRKMIGDAVPSAHFPLQTRVAESLGFPADLTIAVARRCKAAIANDSGGGHLMAAADIPLLSLFGPTSPDKFAPSVARGTILTAQSFGSPSMEVIPVSAVLTALEALLTPPLKRYQGK
ncbi:MAG: glycosyltransferase family 9 protein [Alphaproteobacteria bacterium]|nr:glycosyltransferase family 9 protein [Alphaproteobacteria bacterium]